MTFKEDETRDNSQHELRQCGLCIQQSVYKDSLEAEGRKTMQLISDSNDIVFHGLNKE